MNPSRHGDVWSVEWFAFLKTSVQVQVQDTAGFLFISTTDAMQCLFVGCCLSAW
jgi:hypothetical protein